MRKLWLVIPLILIAAVWLYGCDEMRPTEPAASGLCVDLLCLLAVNLLPKKVPYRIKLKKVLTQNLA